MTLTRLFLRMSAGLVNVYFCLVTRSRSLPRESMSVRPRLLSVAELSHHLAESYLTCSLYVQEMLQYKRQNHGKVTIKA